jgi:UDP-glucose 4-epimerase
MRWFIVGGAGFIGSHFADKILEIPGEFVTLYDNLSSGRRWHFEHHLTNENFKFIIGDIQNTEFLEDSMCNHDVVIHLASNPDISKAMTKPDIDFWQGTALTNYVLEAMRKTNVRKILYASGSGVYGDLGYHECCEFTQLMPVSTYGASKLAGESLIRAYSEMFNISGSIFRFGNVVGARQTHGVGYDFTKNLLKDPTKLMILGDGKQSKSYIHVSDVVSAVLTANQKQKEKLGIYNVATKNYITVNQIAKIVVECLNLNDVKFEYTGGKKGWKGDVPVIRLSSDLIRSLGWKNKLTTEKAIKRSIIEMIPDIKSGKIK